MTVNDTVAPATIEATATPRVFTFLSDEIEQAKHRQPGHRGAELALPGTDELTARIKVYIEGGENKMHSHPKEDHIFFVLSGTATFHVGSDENATDVSTNEAISLPRGTQYWFTNTGDSNLVILRVGSGPDASYRLDANGEEITSGLGTWRYEEGRALA